MSFTALAGVSLPGVQLLGVAHRYPSRTPCSRRLPLHGAAAHDHVLRHLGEVGSLDVEIPHASPCYQKQDASEGAPGAWAPGNGSELVDGCEKHDLRLPRGMSRLLQAEVLDEGVRALGQCPSALPTV